MKINKFINTISFALSSKSRFKELAYKALNRFFDIKGKISKEENLKWIKDNCSDYFNVFKNIDSNLWQQSLNYAQIIKQDADKLLPKIGYNLGGGAIYPVLYFLTKFKKPKCIVETGVAAGFSSSAFLQAIKENNQGILYSSDFPYFRLKNPLKYVGILVQDGLKNNWKVFTEGDRFNIPKIKEDIIKRGGAIDMFCYDSDKSYRGRSFAANQINGLLADGAIVIFDDIEGNAHFFDYLQKYRVNKYFIFNFENKYTGIIWPKK